MRSGRTSSRIPVVPNRRRDRVSNQYDGPRRKRAVTEEDSTDTHVEPILDEHLARPKVEPRVELVDDTLVPDDRKQPARYRSAGDGGEDGESKQCRGVDEGGLA